MKSFQEYGAPALDESTDETKAILKGFKEAEKIITGFSKNPSKYVTKELEASFKGSKLKVLSIDKKTANVQMDDGVIRLRVFGDLDYGGEDIKNANIYGSYDITSNKMSKFDFK